MKINTFKTVRGGLTNLALAAGLAMVGQSALACSSDLWAQDTGVTLGGPEDTTPNISRFSGLCAMQADSAGPYVVDDSPGGINRIRARFYMYVNQDADAAVYRGFDSSNGQVFEVSVNPTSGDVVFSSVGASTSATCPGCANDGFWNSIEVDWNADGGNLSLWVNTDARDVPADDTQSLSTAATVSTVRLGNLDGVAGTMNFDAYESRRTTEIGRLLRGDADANGAIGGGDITAIINEFLNVQLSNGQPDCDGNGSVGGGDITCVINIFLNIEQP